MATMEREFTTHQNILSTVMHRQAGTLDKALLEAVMNSVDAQATRVYVSLTRTEFEVRDNGVGIRNETELKDWFDTFGTPHPEGDGKIGEFRIGRGQLYSYAVNTWRTGTFQMLVDVRNGSKFGYTLNDELPKFKGTHITGKLYDELSASEYDEVVKAFTELVRYTAIPVVLNGKTVSKKPESLKWDLETDDAYIKLTREGDLKVYNLGVLVRGFSSWNFGCGGTVVTKQRLQLNSARNDIQTSQCGVWRRITNILKELNLKRVTTKGALTKEEREFISRQWVFKQLPENAGLSLHNVKLFSDVTGRQWSLNELARHGDKLVVARDSQSKIGTRLHREGKAFVLAESTLSRFRMDSLDELLDFLRESEGINLTHKAADLTELALGCSDIYETIPDSALSAKQLLVLSVLRQKYPKYMKWFEANEKSSGPRSLIGGRSEIALAWTDGSQYIAFGTKELDNAADDGVEGFFSLLLTLTHEMIHDDASLESHDHSEVFYNRHHDLIQYRGAKLLRLAQETASLYLRTAKKSGIDLGAHDAAASRRPAALTKTQARAAEFAKAQLSLFSQ